MVRGKAGDTSAGHQVGTEEEEASGEGLFLSLSIESSQHTEMLQQSSPCASEKELKECTVKRKVGRPIAYSGDPFSPTLQPEERRIVLRRIANRESARRVWAKRQDELEQLRLRAQDLQDSNLQLHARLRACEAKELQARRELAEVRAVMNRQACENEALRIGVNTLSRAVTKSRNDQRLPNQFQADVPAGVAPLLLDPEAPLAPFEHTRDGCELLERPDTPTGLGQNMTSAFSMESAKPFQMNPPQATPTGAPERTFSDLLQDVDWSLYG